ncbi:MAG TPA: hypothetical protein VNB64_03865 [Solirubrobacteraceae bacterium]|nr:hypothetical protein [Solirubrobacteraceae bacterium]
MLLRGGIRWAVGLALAAGALAAPAAHAADPGRWTLTGRSTVPVEYYQGVAGDGPVRPNLFFAGIHVGLYRTDSELRETGRANNVIPPQVTVAERYNHIGDIAYDAREGGRVLLPMECYYPQAAPGQSDPNNTCRTGSIAVADPRTLQWRYYVKLDPAEIPKVMWVALSPDRQLLWTGVGNDLLAYRADDIRPSNAHPAAPPIKAVRRIPNARPPSGVTGAAFRDGRLYMAGQDNPVAFQVWSMDLDTGARRLEIERVVIGESEGIDFFAGLGGDLHWIIAPYNTRNLPTEAPPSNSALLHFVPKPGTIGSPRPAGPVGARRRPARIQVAAYPSRARAGRMTRFRFRTTVLLAGRRRPVAGALVRFVRRRVVSNRAGWVTMWRRLPAARYRVGATKEGLRAGSRFVPVLRRR